MKPKHLLLLGYPMIALAIWDWKTNGLYPGQRRLRRKR